MLPPLSTLTVVAVPLRVRVPEEGEKMPSRVAVLQLTANIDGTVMGPKRYTSPSGLFMDAASNVLLPLPLKISITVGLHIPSGHLSHKPIEKP